MKKYIYLIFLLFSLQAFAQNPPPVNAPSQPTKPSQPIPSLLKTKNLDTVLSEKVQAAIRANKMLKDQAVSAACTDGKVILQGSVKTKQQEEAAINTARSVHGIKKVESQLTIKNQ